MRTLLYSIFCFCFISLSALAQEDPFPYGRVTYREMGINSYEKDTSASAIVLNELGEAFIDNSNNHNLIFKYHVKIKILKKEGLSLGDINIHLYKDDGRYEKLNSVKASSWNLENGSLKETKLLNKDVFTSNYNKYWDVRNFAIPNVKEGSIIEYEYTIESPFFVSNFRPWEFQSDIPKIRSEYCATIPANYRYNIALKGFLTLKKSESEVLKDYFTPGGGRKADCVRYRWSMEDVPAFKEEDYMTARRNFVSAIHFELEEIQYFDGRKDKITKAWKDVEQELHNHTSFGIQIKRGKDVVDAHIESVIANETNDLAKAEKIYDFIRGWYRWNEFTGKYSDAGIKKAFDQKVGNVGDINLSLIAALEYAGLSVEPMILATRDKGLPIELYPVLTDFNYVVAKLNLGDKIYMLDATDDFVPFGVLPERCLNGRGRVLGEKESYWYKIDATERAKQLTILNLKLDSLGVVRGTIQTTSVGYKAAEKRRKIYALDGEEQYRKNLTASWHKIKINDLKLVNLESFSKPLVENTTIEMEAFDIQSATQYLFNPLIVERWTNNPFKSSERLYPVDFGAPLDETIILNLEYPPSLELIDPPEQIALTLPNKGGRFIYSVQQLGNKLIVNNSLLIIKPVFSSDEYHYLKELFNRVVSAHATDLIFRKRK